MLQIVRVVQIQHTLVFIRSQIRQTATSDYVEAICYRVDISLRIYWWAVPRERGIFASFAPCDNKNELQRSILTNIFRTKWYPLNSM